MSFSRQVQRKKTQEAKRDSKHCILVNKVLNECFTAECIPIQIQLIPTEVCETSVQHTTVLCPQAETDSPFEAVASAIVTQCIPCDGKVIVTGLVEKHLHYTAGGCFSSLERTMYAPFFCCVPFPGMRPDIDCKAKAEVECQEDGFLRDGRAFQFAACVKITVEKVVKPCQFTPKARGQRRRKR